jgi:hypothetical protein
MSDNSFHPGLGASPDPSLLSSRLDHHHHPETNGRTPICRRCGFSTSGTLGNEQHAGAAERPVRAQRWLDQQALLSQVALAKARLNG